MTLLVYPFSTRTIGYSSPNGMNGEVMPEFGNSLPLGYDKYVPPRAGDHVFHSDAINSSKCSVNYYDCGVCGQYKPL